MPPTTLISFFTSAPPRWPGWSRKGSRLSTLYRLSNLCRLSPQHQIGAAYAARPLHEGRKSLQVLHQSTELGIRPLRLSLPATPRASLVALFDELGVCVCPCFCFFGWVSIPISHLLSNLFALL